MLARRSRPGPGRPGGLQAGRLVPPVRGPGPRRVDQGRDRRGAGCGGVAAGPAQRRVVRFAVVIPQRRVGGQAEQHAQVRRVLACQPWRSRGRHAICSSLTLTPSGVAARVELGVHRNPVRVVVAAMVLTMTSWLVSGRPRQLRVMSKTAGARSCSTWRCRAEVADRDRQPGFQGECGQLGFPRPGAVPVGPARVHSDQQPRRARVGDLHPRCSSNATVLKGDVAAGVSKLKQASPRVVRPRKGWPAD